jgi:hypothetical protein
MRTGGAAGAHRGVGGEIVVGRGGELLPARRQPVRGMRELVETCLLMHVRARRSTSTRTHAVRARAAGTAAGDTRVEQRAQGVREGEGHRLRCLCPLLSPAAQESSAAAQSDTGCAAGESGVRTRRPRGLGDRLCPV